MLKVSRHATEKDSEREYEEHNARDGCRVSMSFTSTGQYPARFNPVHGIPREQPCCHHACSHLTVLSNRNIV